MNKMTSKIIRAVQKPLSYLEAVVMDQKLTVAYVGGWLGKNNLGDEALFEAAKFLFYRFYLLRFDASRPEIMILKQFPFIKAGILAGGTLINKPEDWWLELPSKFLDICPNLFVFGTGVAHPSFWEGRRHQGNMIHKWKPLLEKCEYIGVRGPMSAELLTDVGIKDVEVVGDPVLVFAEDKISTSIMPNSIGLNIGTADGNVWGDEDTICSEFIKLATLARKANWTVKWFVVWPKDLQITQKAAELSKTSHAIYKIYNDYGKYIELVKPLAAFVGMKLHATILATCAFVPSIMLEYRPKCRDYMKSIGQEASTFRTDDFRAEFVWELVCSWNSKRAEVVKELYGGVKRLQEIQLRRAQELMTRMGIDRG